MEIKRSDKMNNWSFGIDNDKLIGLVLEGKKTATSSLYNFDKIPVIGEESIIHFDNEKDACIVETVDYKIIKYNEITEELAKLEGEGDLSLNYWKQVHLNFLKSVNPNFKEDDKIIFEIFKVTKNLVEERLKLGKSIASKNTDLLGNIVKVEEINSGFNNTLFNINDKYVIKVCTNKELENTFETEKDFYLSNKDNCFIPKLYKYNERKIKNDISYNMLKLVNSYPKVPELHQFDENIKKLSSNFCEIFNQAYVAEQMNLNEIAGIGYRKALEFLIKDYCIDKNKEQEEKIKKEPLSQVITNYILSDKIKNLAKASIWIGNDETHYVRKYEDKDIKDLKRFISATVAYITYELIADSAQEFVNN